MSTVHPDPGKTIAPTATNQPAEPPEFSAMAIVLEVQEALIRAGVPAEPIAGQIHQATAAAANLLRALGVRPSSSPQNGPGSGPAPARGSRGGS